MIRSTTSILLALTTAINFAISPVGSPARQFRIADQVEGNYKLKAITINPGIDYGTGTGVVTDLLAFTIKSGSSCLSTVVITFHSGGTITTANTPACQEEISMGPKETDHWTRTTNELLLTDADGKQTKYALSFSGNLMRLTGKVGLSGLNDKRDHELSMTLVRQ